MPWYTASIIQTVRYRDTSLEQKTIPAYENFVLVHAGNPEQAQKIAIKHGQEACSIDDQLRLNGFDAYMKFEGIRKLIEATQPLSADDDLEVKNLTTGTEVSYSYIELDNEADVSRLATGKKVSITYIDSDN